jgi:hypothetical protein
MVFNYQKAHSVGSPYAAGFLVVLVPDNSTTTHLGLDGLHFAASRFSLKNFYTAALAIFLATIFQCFDGFLGTGALSMGGGYYAQKGNKQ